MEIQTLRWHAEHGWQCGSDDVRDANLVLYFGATDTVTRAPVFESLRALFPGALVAGCSAGSQIVHAEVQDDALIAVALKFGRSRVRGAVERIASGEQSHEVGARLAQRLAAPDLAGVLVLSDGLSVNGTLLVRGMVSVFGESVPLSGGLAGDGARFVHTAVGLNAIPAAGQVAAIGFYGADIRISHSAAGGWDAFGPPRRISRATGNVLYALDDSPALDLYERYLGEEAQGLPGTALLYPLKVWDPARNDDPVVRTVLAIDRNAKSMTFAGDLPQGWMAQLMRGRHDRLVDGAARAAGSALSGMAADAQGAKLALLVSCVGRRLLMGQRASDEVEAVSEMLDTLTTQIGFYSYGEIAPRENLGKCDLHNQTMTVTMIAESC